MTDHVRITDEPGGVRLVQLMRPEKKNALTGAMYDAMREALAFETWGASSGPYVPRETLFQR